MNIYKNKGFSLQELVITLAITGVLSYLSYNIYSKSLNDNSKTNEISTIKEYSGAVGNLIRIKQTQIADQLYGTQQIIVISPEILQAYNLLPKGNKYTEILENNGKRKLYPCTTIFYSNNQLQGFMYFRTDDTYQYIESSPEKNKLMKALNNGLSYDSDLGILNNTNGQISVTGSKMNWKLDANQINTYFKQSGVNILGLQSCKGNYIAYPSYGYYLGNILSFQKTRAKNPTTISQYEIGRNTNLGNINLDSTIAQGGNSALSETAQNKLIFQTNPNCVMDPSKLSTMQDYDPTPVRGCTNINSQTSCAQIPKPNPFGCRNRQLSIGVESKPVNVNNMSNLTAVTVNGFTQNNTTGVTTGTGTSYLGALSAYAIQPSAKVGYASSCSPQDVGTMAVQNSDPASELANTPTALIEFHKLNQNLMICQKSILCPGSIVSGSDENPKLNLKFCWLPLNTMDIKINFPISQQAISFRAPEGYFIKPGSVTYYPTNPTEIILQNFNRSMQTIGGMPDIPASKQRTGYDLCDKSGSDFFGGGWHTNGGKKSLLDENGNLITTYIGMDTFAPQFINTSSSIWQDSSNGWKIITDQTISTDLYNYLSPYAKWQMHGSDQNTNYVSQKIDWDWYAGDITKNPNNKLPIIVNPKYVLYGTHWGNSGSGNHADCDGWKGMHQLLTDMRYISSVTITNDTSYITSISNTPAPNPPIPPVVSVDRFAWNGYVVCGGTPTSNPLVFMGGSCWHWNSYKTHEGSSEWMTNQEVQIGTSYTTKQVGNQTEWTVILSSKFKIEDNIANTLKNAKNAGATTLTYRYTVYSDNSCMAGPGQVCWLYNDTAHTSPHYSLRTVAP
jgi:Tfp pilus assembly major pilin PilA